MQSAFGLRFVTPSLLALACACSAPDGPPASEGTTEAAPVPVTAAAVEAPAPVQAGGDSGESEQPAGEPVPEPERVEAAPAQVAPSPAPAGRDFIAEVRTLYRVVACAGEWPIPDHLDARVVAKHCARLDRRKARYRERYIARARPFLTALHPADLPTTLVYPFGGGDLISALTAFPEASEITTLSLELAGDPRRIHDVGAKKLRHSLSAISREIGGLLSSGSNTSKNLSHAHKNHLPAQLSSFLIGLAVHDFEPVSARYFSLREDGTLRYLDDGDIGALAKKRAERLKYDWEDPNFSVAFAHVELQFRRRGSGPDEPVRIHRHIAANLDNQHLQSDPAVLRHLEAKGKVAMLTKGASYLLWRKSFARVRTYMLDHLTWMLSDSTGIPPRFARKAGMKQTTLGRFRGSLLKADEGHNDDFRALYRKQKRRYLGFRFGYVDNRSNAHLLITEPREPR